MLRLPSDFLNLVPPEQIGFPNLNQFPDTGNMFDLTATEISGQKNGSDFNRGFDRTGKSLLSQLPE